MVEAYQQSAIESLTECSEALPSGKSSIGNIARETLVTMLATRSQDEPALAHATALSAAAGMANSPQAGVHSVRCAHLFSLLGDHNSAQQCYSQELSDEAPRNVALQHAATCMHLGRQFRRDCLRSLDKAIAPDPSEDEVQELFVPLGTRRPLSRAEEWQAYYSLAILYLQDDLVQQAHAMFTEAIRIVDGPPPPPPLSPPPTPPPPPPRPPLVKVTPSTMDLTALASAEEAAAPPPMESMAEEEAAVFGDTVPASPEQDEAEAEAAKEEEDPWPRDNDVRVATLFGLGACLQQQGKLKAALEVCEEVHKLGERHVGVMYLQALLLAQLRRPADAETVPRRTTHLPRPLHRSLPHSPRHAPRRFVPPLAPVRCRGVTSASSPAGATRDFETAGAARLLRSCRCGPRPRHPARRHGQVSPGQG